MALSRPKDGVATLAYVPANRALLSSQGVDARDKRGHDERCVLAERTREPVLAERTRELRRSNTRPNRPVKCPNPAMPLQIRRRRYNALKSRGKLVGAPRFELGTPSPPDM